MTKVLIPQYYGGEEEWREHFIYLLRFFRDERYIKEDGKPVFVLYRPTAIPCLDKMMAPNRRFLIGSVPDQEFPFCFDMHWSTDN